MAVSNFQVMNPLVAQASIVDWQQLSGFNGVEYFHGQDLFAQSRGPQEIVETLDFLRNPSHLSTLSRL